jgi:UPF0716 family protein affecting phage T7 exclusion
VEIVVVLVVIVVEIIIIIIINPVIGFAVPFFAGLSVVVVKGWS